MKNSIKITLITILLFSTINYASNGQSIIQKNVEDYKTEIEEINSRIEQLYKAENTKSLMELYSKQLAYFPEYKPAIFEKEKLKNFFNDWFKAGDVKAYKKKIFMVEAYSDHLLEIGTFRLDYLSANESPAEFTGKYMILWEKDIKGKLTIVSETFGADTYIEPEAVPYASVHVQESNFVPNHQNIKKELLREIEENDALLLKAVAEGDGNARANGFTKDAVLMSNFDSIRVGMEVIRPKMLKTYTPATPYIVNHTYSRIYDLGDYVFINGHYKGGLGDSVQGGNFQGKMSNLMKRNENGVLLMHRQIGNRDKAQY
ncbi:hypothetical protein SYJ56_13820 [Algoriphagus sp. D3-2-R+10]|uniref:hypothetical protein n=1 Tax=Algoriphagus aurantiacus TaxID=3103948 RepID=UPI002B3D88F3|nr:hypothetical protein [Algoriphagus sp. D3-2-R+10]MEB2776395.1 hypothetical protein [Algoriphagus sp. D3-2-R+10]